MAKKKKGGWRDFDIPAKNIIGNIIFAKDGVWAYYILSELPYYAVPAMERVRYAQATMTAISSLCQSADKKVECHLKIVNVPFDVDSWEEQIRENHNFWVGSEDLQFRTFVREQVEFLKRANYQKRVTYLGVKLFARNVFDLNSINVLEFSFKDSFDAVKQGIRKMFYSNIEEVLDEEEAKAKDRENEVHRLLANSALRAKRPSAEELLLHMKTSYYPTMPTPYLDVDTKNRVGLSDIVIETGGIMNVRSRWIQFNQQIDEEEYVGYKAVLSFAKYPDNYQYPSLIPPFLWNAEVYPYTINGRFILLPTMAMKKEATKQKALAEEAIKNWQQSGQMVHHHLKETLHEVEVMEREVDTNKMPFMSSSFRIVVEARSEEELKNRISALRQSYLELGFVLTWSTGDQLDLFQEELFGGTLKVTSFQQTTNLDLIGLAGINYGENVGDPVKQVKRTKRK